MIRVYIMHFVYTCFSTAFLLLQFQNCLLLPYCRLLPASKFVSLRYFQLTICSTATTLQRTLQLLYRATALRLPLWANTLSAQIRNKKIDKKDCLKQWSFSQLRPFSQMIIALDNTGYIYVISHYQYVWCHQPFLSRYYVSIYVFKKDCRCWKIPVKCQIFILFIRN